MNCKMCGDRLAKKYSRIYDDRHGYPGKFNILKCITCGFMQTNPQLSTKKLYSLYTNYYPKRDANIKDIVINSKNLPSKKTIKRDGLSTTCHFFTKRGQNVLDIGCGTCQSLLEIKKLGGIAWGIDVDKNSQNVAKKLKLKFQLGTIHNCNFPKKYFNLITASQVLEHEPDPIKFLIDCKKFLKDDGKIILSFPNTDSLGRELWKSKWLHWHIPYHLNHFNKQSVRLMVQRAGLKVDSIKTVTPNLWIILQIKSFLNKVKIGERDPMWDGNPNTKGSKKRIYNQLSKLNSFLRIYRVIDYFGLGESFVLNLSNK